LRVNFIESKYISKQKEVLKEKFKERYIEIENAITLQTVESLIDVDKIDIVYDYNIYDINDEVEDIYREISNNISSIDQWEEESVRILDKLDEEIKDIFA
ncbi:(p)ppGpp synthetase, partial [Clostridium butyricum]|nr:(p)ppGpp synthetase [Clostridium butyricum]